MVDKGPEVNNYLQGDKKKLPVGFVDSLKNVTPPMGGLPLLRQGEHLSPT